MYQFNKHVNKLNPKIGQVLKNINAKEEWVGSITTTTTLSSYYDMTISDLLSTINLTGTEYYMPKNMTKYDRISYILIGVFNTFFRNKMLPLTAKALGPNFAKKQRLDYTTTFAICPIQLYESINSDISINDNKNEPHLLIKINTKPVTLPPRNNAKTALTTGIAIENFEVIPNNYFSDSTCTVNDILSSAGKIARNKWFTSFVCEQHKRLYDNLYSELYQYSMLDNNTDKTVETAEQLQKLATDFNNAIKSIYKKE